MEVTSLSTVITALESVVGGGQAPAAPPVGATPETVHQFEASLDGPPPSTAVQAPSGLEVGGYLSPADLYQTQFTVGMLKVQGTGGSKVSQQLTQDMETIMKQQG